MNTNNALVSVDLFEGRAAVGVQASACSDSLKAGLQQLRSRPAFHRGAHRICVVLTSILTFSLVSGCGRNQEAAPLPVAVQVATLTNETVACQMRFSAIVREWQQVDLSFKVPGTVKDLLQVPADGSQPARRPGGRHRECGSPTAIGPAGRFGLPAAANGSRRTAGAGSSQRTSGGRQADGGGERLSPRESDVGAEGGSRPGDGRGAGSAGLDRSRAGRDPPRNRRGQRGPATSGRRFAELHSGHADPPGHDRPQARRAA